MTEVKRDKRKRPRLAFIDRLVGIVSPERAVRREFYRSVLDGRPNRLASHGRPLGSRLVRDWGRSNHHSPRQLPDDRIDELRNRSRDLDENNAIAAGMVDRMVENVVGQGIRPQPMTDDAGWNKEAETLFNDWAEFGADVRGLDDYWQMQQMFYRNVRVDGDAGMIQLRSGQLQMVSGDSITTPSEKSGDLSMVEGVELNRPGRPIGFHVQDNAEGRADHWTRVDARDFVYLAKRRRNTATRGVPIFSTIGDKFDQVDAALEAIITAMQMSAMLGLLFHNREGAAEGFLPSATDTAGNATKQLDMEPGMARYLEAGIEDVTQIKPQQPAQNAQEFLTFIIRAIGLPAGLPLELMLLDFSRTTFSSARASLLQSQRTFLCEQAFVIKPLRRIYRWRIDKFVKKGLLTPRPDRWKHRQIAPGWPWIEPLKELEARLAGIDANLDTYAAVAASQGQGWREIMEQRKIERDFAEKLGLPDVRGMKTREPGTPADETPEDTSDGESPIQTT